MGNGVEERMREGGGREEGEGASGGGARNSVLPLPPPPLPNALRMEGKNQVAYNDLSTSHDRIDPS